MNDYSNIRDSGGNCEGCPLTIVCLNGKCPDYCQDMADWLEEHDKQIKEDTINEARKICGIKSLPMPAYCDGCKLAILEQGTFIECGLDKIIRGSND